MTIGAILSRGAIAPATYGQQNGTRAKLPALAEGESLLINCRFAQALVSDTTAPESVAWEGPYIRLYAAVNMETLRGTTARVWTGAETISDESGSAVTLPNEATEPYYEFDAINCPLITAPYDLQPELYTDLSGTWVFDWIKFARPRDYKGDNDVKYPARSPMVNARLFPQTRLVSGAIELESNQRTLDVPLGCVEIEPIGTLDTNSIPILQATETDQSAGNAVTRYPLFDADSLNVGFHRVAVGGARKVIISAGNAGAVSGITFWCAL